MSATQFVHRKWHLGHYERHLTTVALEMRNWIERGAPGTVAALAYDAQTLIRGLRRDHEPFLAEPLIARILGDVKISEGDIERYASKVQERYSRG